MRCDSFAKHLDLAPSADTQDPYFTDAAAHLRVCDACRAKMIRRLDAERSIRMTMESMAPVPETLLTSVISATRAVKARRSRWRSWAGMAASFMLVIGLSASGYTYWKQGQTEAAVERLCVLSIRNHEVYHRPEFTTGNMELISKWLSGRLGHFVKMPDLLNIPSVTGARLCALGEHAVAVVNFTIDNKRSSLFSFYPSQFGVEGVTEPPKFEMGYTVAVWDENGVGYSLVSEAPVEKIKAMFASGYMRN